MKNVYFTSSPSQTKKLGEILATELLKKAKVEKRTKFSLSKEVLKTESQKRAMVISLEGDLGGGKTTFLQGFAKGLGIKQKILSPTFVIIKKFQVSSSKFQDFYHLDCYRIQKPKEILDLGFKEIVSGPRNLVAIEWADRIKKIIPKNTIWVRFKFIDEKTREIKFKVKSQKSKVQSNSRKLKGK